MSNQKSHSDIYIFKNLKINPYIGLKQHHHPDDTLQIKYNNYVY